MTLRFALSEDETKAVADLPVESRHAALRLLQATSCNGRTASFMDLDSRNRRLGAIVLQQTIVEPDGSAAMDQRIADGLQEIFVTAVRIYGTVARIVASSKAARVKGPSSDPGTMFQ